MTVAGMLIPVALALVVWSLWSSGYFPYKSTLMRVFTPDDWWYELSLVPRPVEGRTVTLPGSTPGWSPTASSSARSSAGSPCSAAGVPSSATTSTVCPARHSS
ncbi:hypothetical protein SHKM778_21220 [Streptomyces sp. KM77-8]|uniref:Uncharacterized protein n=1 Tax=Streptomyces haneummycinicus TaxID=3074435 RepID=A0AAT9HEW5_9ACTN